MLAVCVMSHERSLCTKYLVREEKHVIDKCGKYMTWREDTGNIG